MYFVRYPFQRMRLVLLWLNTDENYIKLLNYWKTRLKNPSFFDIQRNQKNSGVIQCVLMEYSRAKRDPGQTWANGHAR